MRLLFLLTVTLAAWLTRGFGTRVALFTSAAIVAAAGLLSMAWGALDPTLMRDKVREEHADPVGLPPALSKEA